MLSAMTESELDEKSHDEYTIVDKKGRIKIPEELLLSLDIAGGEKLMVKKNESGIEIKKE